MGLTWEQQTAALLANDAHRMTCLQVARSLQLPDWYIGAGFLRNAIWDACHPHTASTPLNDIDLVYFDAEDKTPSRDSMLEARACERLAVPWEIRNQARMHEKHGNSPYHNTAHAIAHWVEVPTCVGVRLNDDDTLTFTAPFGLGENWSCKVRMNPEVPRPEAYKKRVNDKRWAEHWPRLVFDDIP
ncbi:nucleotidyltransferase family protein [Alteromonas sp. H39]|uniref:nucleotidyltransferase family protein n=1 Tax=Alteromonas sp. H39 TaxID=3389876 RepID=UPI0039E11FF3